MKGETMKLFSNQLNNEKGTVLVVALLILVILTIIGISATTTTNIETQIAGNEKFQKIAFYAAEAARDYVPRSLKLYGGDNITDDGSHHYFPNDTNYVPNTTDSSVEYEISSNPKMYFKGSFVEYTGISEAPRGSGYEAEDFNAHNYRMGCFGYGPSNANIQIEAGFYRIGF